MGECASDSVFTRSGKVEFRVRNHLYWFLASTLAAGCSHVLLGSV